LVAFHSIGVIILNIDNESIGVIPANGYTSEHRQSIKALKWLKYVSERYQINILHSRNRGEKQIGPFKVDGYRETETGDRTVYKFHGCFRHGYMLLFALRKRHFLVPMC
jgi:hypothetical protein